ncbi:MAG: hypothetical protein HOQ44_24340 [Nocardia sp.]|nr:hypothetical protein [Nocardia sp.]
MLRRVVDELHRRVRGAVAGAGRAAEHPPRTVGGEVGKVADFAEGKDRTAARGFGPRAEEYERGPANGESSSSGSADRPPGLVVADELHRIHLSGAQATWTNYHPRFLPQRKFEQWVAAETEGPLPPLEPELALNCRDMVMWAAANSGALTHAQVRSLYAPLLGRRARRNRLQGFLPDGFAQHSLDSTFPHGTRDLDMSDPAGARPDRGNVIMWDGWGERNAHTAVATGRLIGPQRDPEVYSFWPPPTGPLVLGTVTDAVQITTVSRLTPYADGPNSVARPIWFGSGPW